MTEVEWVSFGEIFDLARRAPDWTARSERVEIGLRSFGKGPFHKPPVSVGELGSKKVFQVRAEDLLISNIFAWEGAIALAGHSEEGLVGSHRFMTWRSSREGADARYVLAYLLSNRGLEAIGAASPGSAGRNRTLGVEALKAIKIPLPDLATQQAIAGRLDRLQIAVERLPIVSSPSTMRSNGPKIVAEALASRGFPQVRAAELFTQRHKILRPEAEVGAEYRFVGLEHVESHTGARVGSEQLTALSGRKLRFERNDVLFGYLRPYLNKVWVADGPGLCSVEQYVLRPNAGIDAHLLGHALRSQTVLDQANAATHNLQLPRLRSGLLAQFLVPDIRNGSPEILGQLNSINTRIRQAAKLRERSTALRNSLFAAARHEEFARLLR